MRRAALALGFCIWLAACGKEPAAAGRPGPAGQGPSPLPALEHDFGIIPHGESRQHDYVLDLSLLGAKDTRFVPLRVLLDCSCGRGQLLLRNANGQERLLDGRPDASNAPGPDETVVVRVFLDTITKDAVDLPHTTTRGQVVLQPTNDHNGSLRVSWPLLVRFGIDAPVVLRPFAALDYGRVPVSSTPEIVTTLQGDERHPHVKFGAVTCTDPAIEARLEPKDGLVVLRARCKPGEPGNQRAVLSIATDLPSGYRVNLGVTWKVVPDLEAAPLPKMSFRTDLRREQRADESQGQFLLVVDHDERRPPEFRVHQIVGDDGRDATGSFAVTLAPVPGQTRQQRMFVRYLGGQPQGFRGRIVLSKGGAEGPFLPIELVVFASKDS